MKLILLIIPILLLNLALGANPNVQTTTTGMQIQYPKYDYIKLGYEHRFHVHLINETAPITNKTATCYIHVYNLTGYDMDASLMEWETYTSPQLDFAYTVNKSFLNKIGTYSWVIQCNSSNQIAFASGQIIVNPIGAEFTVSQAITYILLIGIVFAVLITCLLGFIKIQPGNIRNEDGKLYKINYKKYVRWFFAGIMYVCVIALTYFAWNISYAFLNFDSMSNFFKMLFRIELILTIPIFTVSLILMIIYFLQDKKWDEMLARGLHPK